MDPIIHDIIRNSRSDDSTTYTHISFYGPNAKWYIKSGELGSFWKRYCDLVYEKDGRFCLAERSQEHMPILVRATIKFQDVADNFEP